ncbi:MAG: helix-turn-helix transcriptional regulator [Lachnospiraceae bacterium]|nr:helix-turn-helix transcriptional regulator [Lachnospiraceae bacterium]
MISYKPFFETVKNRKLNQYLLMRDHSISASMLDRLKKDKYLSLETIDKICVSLHCDIGEVIKIF